MGTGKSTIGRLLSKKLDFQFVDTDELISQREGACIPDIFLKQGEEYFRDLESLIIERLMKEDKLVVSTGGGAVLRAKNLRLLKENGIVISLMASIETLIRRMD